MNEGLCSEDWFPFLFGSGVCIHLYVPPPLKPKEYNRNAELSIAKLASDEGSTR